MHCAVVETKPKRRPPAAGALSIARNAAAQIGDHLRAAYLPILGGGEFDDLLSRLAAAEAGAPDGGRVPSSSRPDAAPCA